MEQTLSRSFPEKLLGSPERFSLEARIFHSVVLIIIGGVGLNIIFNFLIGLPEDALLMAVVFIAAAGVYYMSRFHDLVKIAMAIFLFGSNIVLAANYYYNSGLNGPTYAIFLLCLLITIAVAPRRQYLVWIPLNVLVMVVLFLYDYQHPSWLPNSYTGRANRFADFVYTYLVIAGLIIFVLVNIRKAYHRERDMVKQRTVELAAANDVKNKLLSVISHDLKEPLTSIQGFLELLADQDIDPPQRRELENELLLRTQNASQLLNNVLIWSRSQMEGLQVRQVRIDLTTLLQPVLGLLEPLAEEKAVTLLSLVQPDCALLGDPDMLQLVLRNILTNAIKYSHPGGDVRLSATLIGDNCVIAVKDEGGGISVAQQAHLFSLQTNSVHGTNDEKGAGLGLYLCRDFMEKQGGTISYTTEPGRGTTFMVSLPRGT
jgi:two-component system sensor histidine kinase/response regulator